MGDVEQAGGVARVLMLGEDAASGYCTGIS